MKIDGLVALVSGGGSGLGRATAEVLAERGAKVVVFDLKAPQTQPKGSLAFETGDVRSEEDVSRAVTKAASLGDLRIAVNCAGIGSAGRLVGKAGPMPLDDFRRVIDVNLIGTFNVMRLAAAAMAGTEPDDGERGVVINTASIAAFEGQIGQLPYAASKAAIVGMTICAARDLASLLIRVVTIAPGTFDTPLLAGLREDIKDELAAAIPHPRRLGQPREYAQLAVSIIENPMLNGETIRLDGALRMAPR